MEVSSVRAETAAVGEQQRCHRTSQFSCMLLLWRVAARKPSLETQSRCEGVKCVCNPLVVLQGLILTLRAALGSSLQTPDSHPPHRSEWFI